MANPGANEASVLLKLQHPEIGLRTVPEIDPDLSCQGPNPDRAVGQGLQVLHFMGPFRIIFEEILANEPKHFLRTLPEDNARSAYHRLAGTKEHSFPSSSSSVELIRRAIGSMGLTKITFSEKSGVEKLTQQRRKMGCVYRKLLGVSACETDLADCTAPSTVQGVRIR